METKREKKCIRPTAGLLLLCAVMLSLAGCVKRELEIRPDEGCVAIAVDWSCSGTSVRSARYLFYNEAGSLVKEVSGLTDGFRGSLPTGTYRLVVHNTDGVHVGWRGCERYESAEVFARTTDSGTGSRPGDGVPCILEPREVFAAGCCNESRTVEVRQLDTTRLSVTPAALVKRVAIRFSIETDAGESVRSLRGILSGVSSGYFPGQGCANTSSSCAMEFEGLPDSKGVILSYTSEMNVFGLLTTAQSDPWTNTVALTLVLSDGTESMGRFDLTSALQELLASGGGVFPESILLEVKLRLHETVLSATVSPWDDKGSGSGDITLD